MQPRAYEIAQQVRKALIEIDTARSCRILGPAPAPLARLRSEFRFPRPDEIAQPQTECAA
jgi:primosomal protein N'